MRFTCYNVIKTFLIDNSAWILIAINLLTTQQSINIRKNVYYKSKLTSIKHHPQIHYKPAQMFQSCCCRLYAVLNCMCCTTTTQSVRLVVYRVRYHKLLYSASLTDRIGVQYRTLIVQSGTYSWLGLYASAVGWSRSFKCRPLFRDAQYRHTCFKFGSIHPIPINQPFTNAKQTFRSCLSTAT